LVECWICSALCWPTAGRKSDLIQIIRLVWRLTKQRFEPLPVLRSPPTAILTVT
jgi:hypothetical protein